MRAALQLPGEEACGSASAAAPNCTFAAVAPGAPDGTPLLVLQAHDAGTVEDLLDGEGKGRLLTPAQLGPTTIEATATAVSEVFQSEEPPALVLVTAGAWLLLAERGSWPEGRWLAVDLATVVRPPGHQGRRRVGDRRPPCCRPTPSCPATTASTLLLTLLEESVKHAVGVSQDLRDGIRESIELLATDVLRRRRASGHARRRARPGP